jgi:hypothetical protein
MDLDFFGTFLLVHLKGYASKRWLILLGIALWLHALSELLIGSLSEWTIDEYLNVFYLCASTYLIVFVWKSTTQPIKESTRKSWLILLGIVFWLNWLKNLSELLIGSLSEWTIDEYLNVFHLCASTFLFISCWPFVWKSTTQPIKESTQRSVSKDDEGQS